MPGPWRAAMSSVDTELEKLRALLADYCIESTPQAELCILLTTGRASAALQQFLSSHLGVSRCALAACPGTEKGLWHASLTRTASHVKDSAAETAGGQNSFCRTHKCHVNVDYEHNKQSEITGSESTPYFHGRSVRCMSNVHVSIQETVSTAEGHWGVAGDAGVKRLARGVDAAVQRVHSLLVDVMQPGLEAIAFALSDTAGPGALLPMDSSPLSQGMPSSPTLL